MLCYVAAESMETNNLKLHPSDVSSIHDELRTVHHADLSTAGAACLVYHRQLVLTSEQPVLSLVSTGTPSIRVHMSKPVSEIKFCMQNTKGAD